MKIKTIALASIVATSVAFTACNNTAKQQHKEEKTEDAHDHDEATEGMAVLSDIQRKAIDLKIGELPHRQMSGLVKTTGQLEVSPSNKAEVTAYIGGNVVSIAAFQGDKVEKGQVLATLEHPDIIQLQQDFIEKYNNLQYLEKEYNRQKELYQNQVGSGKNFQRVEADYNTAKAQYQGLKLRLKMLKLKTARIEKGHIAHQLKVLSPISGYVSGINISLGSYIDARTKMFSIRNFDKIHADLSVYEKDINQVKEGQTVRLKVANLPNTELKGKVFAIAKEYETNSRSIVVHASIENPPKKLIADSYVSGEILTNSQTVAAVPETAIVNDGGKQYIFVFDAKGSEAANHQHEGEDHEAKDEDHDHNNTAETHSHDAQKGDTHNHEGEEHNHDGEKEGDTHNHEGEHNHETDGHIHDIVKYKALKDQKIAYRMVEVIPGLKSEGYVAITAVEKLAHDAVIVLDGAYYLLSDLKKSEAAHQH